MCDEGKAPNRFLVPLTLGVRAVLYNSRRWHWYFTLISSAAFTRTRQITTVPFGCTLFTGLSLGSLTLAICVWTANAPLTEAGYHPTNPSDDYGRRSTGHCLLSENPLDKWVWRLVLRPGVCRRQHDARCLGLPCLAVTHTRFVDQAVNLFDSPLTRL